MASLENLVFKTRYGDRISIKVAHGGFKQVRIGMQVVGAGGLAGDGRNRVNTHFLKPARVFERMQPSPRLRP